LRALTDHLDVGLDDGQWHDVSVLRPLLGEHVLTVDGDVVQLSVQPLTNDFVRKVNPASSSQYHPHRLGLGKPIVSAYFFHTPPWHTPASIISTTIVLIILLVAASAIATSFCIGQMHLQ